LAISGAKAKRGSPFQGSRVRISETIVVVLEDVLGLFSFALKYTNLPFADQEREYGVKMPRQLMVYAAS
jgi:hypothetical protein